MMSVFLSAADRCAGSVRCVPAVLVCLGLTAMTAVTAAEESEATKAVRFRLEQQTSERSAAEKERRSQAAAISEVQKKIVQLQAELAAAAELLKQHREAEQQATDRQFQAITVIVELTESLQRHRNADALRAAVVAAEQELQAGRRDVLEHQQHLQQLRVDASAAGEAAVVAAREAAAADAEAELKEPELSVIQTQVREAALTLETARVAALQASRTSVELQRHVSLQTFEMNRAQATCRRLARSSSELLSAKAVLQAAGDVAAENVQDETVQLDAILTGLTHLQTRADRVLADRAAEVDRLQEQARAAATKRETAETDRRKKAEMHSILSRRYFSLQRNVGRLIATSRQQRRMAQQQNDRQQQLTQEVAQAESRLIRLEADVVSLTIAWTRAERRAEIAVAELTVLRKDEDSSENDRQESAAQP